MFGGRHGAERDWCEDGLGDDTGLQYLREQRCVNSGKHGRSVIRGDMPWRASGSR